MFTEYWPAPSTPDPSTVEVTVRAYPLGKNLGIIEGSTGQICRATSAATTCKWRVPQGQQLQLVPFRAGGVQLGNVVWTGDVPSTAGTGPCRTSLDAQLLPTVCNLTAQPGLSVGILEYELL